MKTKVPLNIVEPQNHYGQATILVVEDEDIVRRVAVRKLKALNYHVLEARDGTEALTVLKQHTGPLNLVLTDVMMPKMNGRQLAQEVQRAYPHVKIVFMSGYSQDVLGSEGILDQGFHFIEKADIQSQLVNLIRHLLDDDTSAAA